MANHKQYVYTRGEDAVLDGEFGNAKAFSKVKVGQTALFWRNGLRHYRIPLEKVQRIFRRVEPVYGRLCCGGHNFFMEYLVLVLQDSSEVVLHIGDDVTKQAEALMVYLKNAHPRIQYGRVYD